jgi:hypothetical protein
VKTLRLGILLAFVGYCISGGAQGRTDLPAAAREVLSQFEEEATELDRKTEAEIEKSRARGVADLKKAQDELTRQGKLDDANAVRALIRLVETGAPVALTPATPAGVRKAYREYEEDVAVLYEKAEAEFARRREKTVAELKKIQEAFAKEAKLDEALAVRERMRTLHEGRQVALPDPGYVNHQPTDIGKGFYYDVTGQGAAAGFAIYGTDVYVMGSHLGTAAVHCGLVKENQKGVVRVTVVGPQDMFPASTRNGVTSQPSGRAELAFRVERFVGFQGRPFGDYFTERPAPMLRKDELRKDDVVKDRKGTEK